MGGAATPEHLRLAEDAAREQNWKRWGPYLAEREWATVREDYSADGDCWNYFPHDMARSRAYRWGEDGLLGICDRECRLCFALALWNGKDPILKERLFGLTGPEGNHGEDVKECYYYLDSTPTHSYMKALYKYPQEAFPYTQLVTINRERTKQQPEFEVEETGVFDDGRYFDVTMEYAKDGPDDILIRVTVANRAVLGEDGEGGGSADVVIAPTLWFRNTWTWGGKEEGAGQKPMMKRQGDSQILAQHETLGTMVLAAESGGKAGTPEILFTENETNIERCFGAPNASPYVKDAFHRYIVGEEKGAVNPEGTGTKAAVVYRVHLLAGEQTTLRLRLKASSGAVANAFGKDFDGIFEKRIAEANAFYDTEIMANLTPELKSIRRQAYAGLLWSKQFYHFVVSEWLDGDSKEPPPPEGHKHVRNQDWRYLYTRDVISMPDKWEYPWFAAWDWAFHTVAFARIDPEFAKDQLLLTLREWYMHPNGQLPAYEFAFSDVNPPVHAWACWRVYKMTAPRGKRDRDFLARAFQKLLMNFTWWLNRKDINGRHVFSGGFLGLDNIGLFDRSKMLPDGQHLVQADGTAWMGFYCSTMLAIALELASEDPVYEDIASTFFEHVVAIIDAINTLGGAGLWNEKDGYYYDQLYTGNGSLTLPVRSVVGMIPLLAAQAISQEVMDKLPGFAKRMNWFLQNRHDLAQQVTHRDARNGEKGKGFYFLAIPSRERLERMLKFLFDENEFLSPHGIRSVSKYHRDHPCLLRINGTDYRVDYEPGESQTGMFGGNSNWRGPMWMPINFLIVEALERYQYFYGDDFKVAFPTGSGRMLTMREVVKEFQGRAIGLFTANGKGERACHGMSSRYAVDPAWKDLVLFYEYFHGETGQGLGASHQTGWTALIATWIEGFGRDKAAKGK